jgi:hypothetical protein
MHAERTLDEVLAIDQNQLNQSEAQRSDPSMLSRKQWHHFGEVRHVLPSLYIHFQLNFLNHFIIFSVFKCYNHKKLPFSQVSPYNPHLRARQLQLHSVGVAGRENSM